MTSPRKRKYPENSVERLSQIRKRRYSDPKAREDIDWLLRRLDAFAPLQFGVEVRAHGLLAKVATAFGYSTTGYLTAVDASVPSSHLRTARRMAAFVLREYGFSFPQIGRALNRHHTTAITWFKEVTEHELELREASQLVTDFRLDEQQIEVLPFRRAANKRRV